MNQFNLEKMIKRDFTSVTVERGYDYFAKNRVLTVSQLDARDEYAPGIQAVVKGKGQSYTVAVCFDDNELISFCTCPVGYQCKHAVAACLSAEKLGRLPGMEAEAGNLEHWMKSLSDDEVLWSAHRLAQESFDDVLFYVLDEDKQGLFFAVKECKPGQNNRWSKGRQLSEKSVYSRQSIYRESYDEKILSMLSLRFNGRRKNFYLNDPIHAAVFQQLLLTGRCVWQDPNNPPFSRAESQVLTFSWEGDELINLKMDVSGDAQLRMVYAEPMYGLDIENFTYSLVQAPVHASMLRHLLELPTLTYIEAQKFSHWVNSVEVPIPVPIEENLLQIVEPLVPVLVIYQVDGDIYAEFWVQYGQWRMPFSQLGDEGALYEHEGKLVTVKRDEKSEQEALGQLFDIELIEDDLSELNLLGYRNDKLYPRNPAYWLYFDADIRPFLLEQGWLIEQNEPLPKVIDIEKITGKLESDLGDWFRLGLSVELGDKKIDLIEMLLNVLPELNNWQAIEGDVLIPHEQNFLRIDASELKPVLRIIEQLTDDKHRLPKHHVAVINDLPFVDKWSGDKKLKTLAAKLASFQGVAERKLPKGFKAELRDYQHTGYEWLGFLNEYGFGGILADDMGLGKTIQTLTHLLSLKQRRKLTLPALVVCPTSLVHNWKLEAKKFTPTLKVLVVHGPDRHTKFADMANHDIVITTYPLIVRDIDTLKEQPFSTLILDEAQAIKNANTKMARMVRTLNAQHRLCLSGTPLENHLGELWAQFDFLMPGYLGSRANFKEYYQKPIESGDHDTQAWLNKRIAPFMLRRTKDQVAKELPEKTEIIQSIELPKSQRILYESIRSTMEKKVRDLLKAKGLAKSQIEFLDALLKLRQACCHSQLVALPEAEKLNVGAKVDYLLEVLPEMIAEGRRVLIFSQFAKMLGILEPLLNKQGIVTTKLTGQTRNREAVINRFKEGEASVFLISLKAGGTGLNLPEADTVIHFDPWWNPAAEQQATDRAHRIGQDKPVFVYKLVAENSIEEKVLELQERKKAMAAAIYDQSGKAPMQQLDADQMLALFQ